mmetsp:Transcript_92543/g.167164  ORF Transcript_92543/g.167164 Transcript_92543/m.167164 type:complete len:316 (+) Transcript_92543:47-994(+)
MSGGSLLRLFQSEYFDAHLHMTYLLRMEQSGVQDYLVNELYKMTDDDIDFYLPQLCQIALLRYTKSSLHRFLLDKAARSMPFALKIHWLVKSIVEDKSPELYDSALAMLNLCEAAMVNSSVARPIPEDSNVPASASAPLRILGSQRSCSEPELQSQLLGSVEDSKLLGEPHESRERRRSKTLGPPSQSSPTTGDNPARFKPPPRQEAQQDQEQQEQQQKADEEEKPQQEECKQQQDQKQEEEQDQPEATQQQDKQQEQQEQQEQHQEQQPEKQEQQLPDKLEQQDSHKQQKAQQHHHQQEQEQEQGQEQEQEQER